MTNRVQDDEPGASKTRGVNDARVKKMAMQVQKDVDVIKSENVMTESRRRSLYSREALLPEDILELIPYKETHQALLDEDADYLAEMLCSFVSNLAKQIWQY